VQFRDEQHSRPGAAKRGAALDTSTEPGTAIFNTQTLAEPPTVRSRDIAWLEIIHLAIEPLPSLVPQVLPKEIGEPAYHSGRRVLVTFDDQSKLH